MKIIFWNVRGLNSGGRRKHLKELLFKHQVDIVCLQETIKQKFTSRELSGLIKGQDLTWEWIAPNGRSGGLLIGANKEILEVLDYKEGMFCHGLILKSVDSGFIWGVINVYGPVQLDTKSEFLKDLMGLILTFDVPMIVGGDFNLVRDSQKSPLAMLIIVW